MKKSLLFFCFLVFELTLLLEIFSVIQFGTDSLSIIPFAKEITLTVHSISAFLLIFCFWGYLKNHFRHVVLTFQSLINVLVGNELIGILLAFVMIILLFCDGRFSSDKIGKPVSVFIYLSLLVVPVFQFGIFRVIFSVILICFVTCLLVCTHIKIERTYGVMIALSKKKLMANLNNETKELNVDDYNFTERDIQLLLEIARDPRTKYLYLSEKYYMSVSNVKKTMSKFYKEFGVEDKKELVKFLSVVKLNTKVQMK